MNNQEYIEYIHPKDTAGYLIFDLHCPYCTNRLHSKDKFPPPREPFKDITKYKLTKEKDNE